MSTLREIERWTGHKRHSAAREFITYTICLMILIGAAIGAFYTLRHLDKGRSQRAEDAQIEKLDAYLQKKQDAADRRSGIQRVYWDKQENGFRDVPVQSAY